MSLSQPEFVGRSAELEALRREFDSARAGAGRFALVAGEAGSGKTRLISEFRASPKADRRTTVATASALDYAQAPYAPIRDLLVTLDQRIPKVAARDPEIARLFESLRDSSRVADEPLSAPEVEKRRKLDGIAHAFTRYAAVSPLILMIEDIHWIDGASAEVLMHLAGRLEDSRLLIVCTYRSEDVLESAVARDLIAKLARRPNCSRLSLHALALNEAHSLVDATLQDTSATVEGRTRRQVCALAEGNPLLLIELLKHALDDPQSFEGNLPLSLQAIVAHRLKQFTEQDREVLRVAAVMGEFDQSALAEIAGTSLDETLRVLRKARDQQVIIESADRARITFSFRHALIRRAIVDELLNAERIDLHRRILERLERVGDSADRLPQLAHHAWMAHCAKKSSRYNQRAGESAMEVFAFNDAASFFERAAYQMELARSNVEVFEKLAHAYEYSSRINEGDKLLESLLNFYESEADGPAVARIAMARARSRYSLLDDDGALSAIAAGLKYIDASEEPTLYFELQSLLAWYLAHLRRGEDATRSLARIAALEHHADYRSLTRYYEARAVVNIHFGDAQHWKEEFEKSIGLAEREAIPLFLYRRLSAAAAAAMASNVEDFEYARQKLDQAVALERQHRLGQGAVFSQAAQLYFLLGNLRNALEFVNCALEATVDNPYVAISIARVGIPLAVRLGDSELLRRCASERLLEHAYASKDPVVFGPLVAVFGAKLWNDNRRSEASLILRRTVTRLTNAGNNTEILLQVARCGLSDSVVEGRKLLSALADSSVSASAALSLVDAYVSSGETRRRSAVKAADQFAQVGWRLHQAESLELADAHQEAHRLYEECGSVTDVVRVSAIFARGKPARSRRSEELSHREWEVARQVTDGKSNRAVAEALVLSERTVENHVASIFAKLAIRSRAEIATYVAGFEK